MDTLALVYWSILAYYQFEGQKCNKSGKFKIWSWLISNYCASWKITDSNCLILLKDWMTFFLETLTQIDIATDIESEIHDYGAKGVQLHAGFFIFAL